MSIPSITIRRWVDRHLHVRHGKRLTEVLPYTLRQKPRAAVFMGNLPEPLHTSTIERTNAYAGEIRQCISNIPSAKKLHQVMTLYLTDHITPQEAEEGFKNGTWGAIKLYMADKNGKGGTTGSQHGVRDLLGRYKIFEVAQKYRIPLLGHFEAVEDEVDEFDREARSLDRDLIPITRSFPGLPIVFEHLTDGRAADFVAESGHPIYGTVTAHHLMKNRNVLFKGGMNPAIHCKPVYKDERHRLHVRKYVTQGNRRFGAGTDSAPHGEDAKARCYGCAAGVFTAPYALELYATVFDEDDALEHLEPFLSENFLHIYALAPSKETITLERKPQLIPHTIAGIPVFLGGTEIPWTFVG